jgi:hypothetical protein
MHEDAKGRLCLCEQPPNFKDALEGLCVKYEAKSVALIPFTARTIGIPSRAKGRPLGRVSSGAWGWDGVFSSTCILLLLAMASSAIPLTRLNMALQKIRRAITQSPWCRWRHAACAPCYPTTQEMPKNNRAARNERKMPACS